MNPSSGPKPESSDNSGGDVLDAARRAFLTLTRAWQERDPELARSFMSPEAHRVWSAKVQQFIDLRKRSVMEGMRLDALDLVGVENIDGFDQATVRFRFACAAYEVDEQSGELLSGDHVSRPATEFWEFRRPAGIPGQPRRDPADWLLSGLWSEADYRA